MKVGVKVKFLILSINTRVLWVKVGLKGFFEISGGLLEIKIVYFWKVKATF